MTSAGIVERVTMLRAIAPFDRLTGRELLLVAEHVRPRSHAPGALLLGEGHVADLLHVVVGGWVTAGAGRAPSLFDVSSLLFALPAAADYRAGPQGAQSLCLSRPHLFTIARECPEFIVGLLDLEALPRCG